MESHAARQHFDGAWPLMDDNITRHDLDEVIKFLSGDAPKLTQGKNVKSFEDEWSDWLGVRHSVFVNSGSSANLITMCALRERYGAGEVIVPAITWVSDIAAVLQAGLTPVFVDINDATLGMDEDEVISKLGPRTRAVFMTHVLGFNALTANVHRELARRSIPLVEDVSESHGATWNGKKLGSFGFASNFSFYFAHHMSTVEGGMVCTDDGDMYQMLRMFRSHGLVRESSSEPLRSSFHEKFSDLNPEFIFAFPAYNVRNTEISAVIGRNQLKRLDRNNEARRENFKLFLNALDSRKYRTDFATEGSCNYAFPLILKEADPAHCAEVMSAMRGSGVEFRRGTAGGGNQLRQPYLRRLLGEDAWKAAPRADHVHFYGFYIGNYPGLEKQKISKLCDMLNGL